MDFERSIEARTRTKNIAERKNSMTCRSVTDGETQPVSSRTKKKAD
jgi:hypothetical protein